MSIVLIILLLGVFATAIIDLWATFSNKFLKFPRTNWAMVGRWLAHIPKGQLVHHPISSAAEVKFEKLIGWAFHYFVGIFYAAIYALIVFYLLEGQATLLSAIVFGLLTILSPWFIMQPCLGMGFCAIKAEQPHKVRLQNFILHLLFGIALYIGWQWLI